MCVYNVCRCGSNTYTGRVLMYNKLYIRVYMYIMNVFVFAVFPAEERDQLLKQV